MTVTGKPFTAQAPVKEDHHYLELPGHPSPLESNLNSALQHLFCPLAYQCPISLKHFPVPSETQGQVSEKITIIFNHFYENSLHLLAITDI